MQYPNRIQAALLLDAPFTGLDALASDCARMLEMQTGTHVRLSENHPGAFARLFTQDGELMLTLEYIAQPPDPASLTGALGSPVTTLYAPDMAARVTAARSHILLEIAHGTLASVDSDRPFGALHDTGALDGATSARTFLQRFDALALMVRVASDRRTPLAVHWTQSNQLLDPKTFETYAQGGPSGPLGIHPVLFHTAPGDDATVGLQTFGARHTLGREIRVPPSALPWQAAYDTLLAFCAFAAMDDGHIIPHGDTFSPPPAEGEEPGGEVWRVLHNDAAERASDNDDADAFGGPAPVFELVPLRHDACGFVAEDYAPAASILAKRKPKAAPEPQCEPELAAQANEEDEKSLLAEMIAALNEGRAEAAANPPEPFNPPFSPAMTSARPSLAGDNDVSGRSLRSKVFGKKDA